MFETTGGERHMEELEAKVLGALDFFSRAGAAR